MVRNVLLLAAVFAFGVLLMAPWAAIEWLGMFSGQPLVGVAVALVIDGALVKAADSALS